jgi:hypothetical protein
VSDHNFALNGNSFADEGVRRNLAPLADAAVPLDLDEWSNPCVGTYAAAIDIDEVRMGDDDAITHGDIIYGHSSNPTLVPYKANLLA